MNSLWPSLCLQLAMGVVSQKPSSPKIRTSLVSVLPCLHENLTFRNDPALAPGVPGTGGRSPTLWPV